MQNENLKALQTYIYNTAMPRPSHPENEAAAPIIEHVIQAIAQAHPAAAPSQSIRPCLILGALPLVPTEAHARPIICKIKTILAAYPDSSVMLCITGQYTRARGLVLTPHWFEQAKQDPLAQTLLENFTASELNRLQFHYPPQGRPTLAACYAAAIDAILAFKPSHALICSGMYYPRMMAELLFSFLPIIRFPFEVNNQYDIRYTDLILTPIPLPHLPSDFSVIQYQMNRRFYLPFPSETSSVAFTKKAEKSLAMVTAIKGGRLSKHFHSDEGKSFLEFILNQMTQLPNLEWHIIGAFDLENVTNLRPEFATLVADNRIKFLPLIQGLDAYIAQADIYLQPLGIGGGATACAIAATRRVPLAVFSPCDGSIFLHFREKALSYSTGKAYLKALISDATFREEEAQKNFDHYTQLCEVWDTQSFKNAFAAADKAFARRTRGSG